LIERKKGAWPLQFAASSIHADVEGVSLFSRVSPLFRGRRLFSDNTLNLHEFRRTQPVLRNPLFLPLSPANPAGQPAGRPDPPPGLDSNPAACFERPPYMVMLRNPIAFQGY